VTTTYAYPAPVIATGVLAHVAAATTGTAVGLLCARPVMHGIGWSVVVGGGVLFFTATQMWLPPVGLTVRALNTNPVPTTTLVAQAVLGLALSALAATVSVVAHNRR
jgi:hypothetical protein